MKLKIEFKYYHSCWVIIEFQEKQVFVSVACKIFKII